METYTVETLEQIPRQQWNALVRDGNPFLRFEFLWALEHQGCVGERTGWLPRHVVCLDDSGDLVGAAPLYVKTNSYGEFVFDWGWAEAYRRYGLSYYPKLVSAIPFTPATGQRLLLASSKNQPLIALSLINHALEEARRLRCSSLHWLFPTATDMELLSKQGLMHRLGCQFHWHNPGYRDFQDFLDTLTSKKRKNINRERRRVHETGVQLVMLKGTEISDSLWATFHAFYCSTFQRLGGIATLTLPFFQEIAATMGDQILLALAWDGKHPVAGAISFHSDNTLYGRHWGCHTEHDSLHFETCYYQGIEYCIRHGLEKFEPGAQGEHKIRRGFLPTLTYSAHWLADKTFSEAVADFLRRETPVVQRYAQDLAQHSPYREDITHS